MTGTRAQWSAGAAGPILAAEEREEGNWRTRGSCVGRDPELWFSRARDDVAAAKAVCAGCPVRERCLEFALENGECGTWGGLDEDELRTARRPRTAPPRPPKPAARQLSVLMPGLTPDEEARFWAKVVPGGCGLTWSAGRWKSGCGIVRITRGGVQASYRAHRVAWKLRTGTDPGPLVVVQACGDQACLTEGCLRTEEPSVLISRNRRAARKGTRADVPAGETRRGQAQRRTAA